MHILTSQGILAALIRYKYAIIFPISVVEGPIISILSGFLASRGIVNIFIVSLLLLLGDLVGDSMYYAIGRFGGIPFLKRWGYFFRVEESGLTRLKSHFVNHGAKVLLVGKTQALGSAILTAAGISKMPYIRFLWVNMAGTIIKTALLVGLGYYFGEAYVALDDYITKIALISSFVLIVGFIMYQLYRKRNV